MKLSKLFFCFVLLTGSAFAQKQTLDNLANDPAKPEFKFETEEHNFGTIKQGDAVTYEFKFTNTGNEPLIITNAEGSCGCTVPVYPKQPIMKGQTASIKVTFNSAGKSGVQDKTVTITSNAKQNPMVLHMKGNVDKSEVPVDTKQK
jgi:hypothetical protein